MISQKIKRVSITFIQKSKNDFSISTNHFLYFSNVLITEIFFFSKSKCTFNFSKMTLYFFKSFQIFLTSHLYDLSIIFYFLIFQKCILIFSKNPQIILSLTPYFRLYLPLYFFPHYPSFA